MPPSLIGVGVGPGDPELVTVRALRVLREAGTVFAPTMSADAVGRAESIVAQAAPDVTVERLVFAINAGPDERLEAHRAAARRVVEVLDSGGTAAFVTLGDPNVFSTFSHLAEAVVAARPGVTVNTVPGIMAFQDLAARSGTVVLDGEESLHLVTAVGGSDRLGPVLADGAAVVVYKGGQNLEAVAAALDAAGRLDGAVYGELLGLGGEVVLPVARAAGSRGAYLGTVLVPPVRAVAG